MKNEIESIVIVTNKFGRIATMRFSNPKFDKIVSSSSKTGIYALIEKHVRKVVKKNG